MKNIASCYSEHAIKVSDSYCSGSSNHAFSSSSSQLTPSTQNTVSCIYKVKLSNHKQFLVKLTWCSLLNYGFSIGFCDYPFSSSKFSKNSRMIRSDRGVKTFELCGLRIEVLWDLSRAEYDSGPEPNTGFYIMVLVNSEVSLFLGDTEEVKKRVSETQVSEFSLISRSERFNGNGVYSTRAKFCETGSCHDILIKCCGEDKKNRVLSVYIDKKSVIEVKRLQWNFRGNQTVFLDGLLVDLMWDLHDWFFGPATGHGVFMFRTRSGSDSRLWLEEKNIVQNEGEKVGFSLLICACNIPD
ncbi:hypothetical protein CDL12_25857 [Handroanthus impetiginosus]|uniref:DUF868 domain-containing protein n=1 Tax=Handroanthus impetiginosus TaxID=429701 RepID=A0A2G9G8T6_9LAMI|nr:hypothetical protein CDL12_25857 [Handroanthus impetiginosus]